MFFDRSWMGYGMVGALEVGLISLAAAFVLFALLHRLGARQGWPLAMQISWALLLALLLTASTDIWDLFYFNFAPLNGLQLLRAKLAEVHDPDAMGLRVLFEFAGAISGIFIGWAIFSGYWRDTFFRPRKDVAEERRDGD